MSAEHPIHVGEIAPERWEQGELAVTRRRLAAAAGARRLGIALIEIDPGRRSTPPHSHADEDEAFLVLAGGGLSYLSSGPGDARTYRVGVDDLLFHPSNGDAHTLIAGDDGMTVLALAEGSRTNITLLPRTGQFWLGPLWSPADTPHPYAADAALGPLELPGPSPRRPPEIRNLAELPLVEGRDGMLAHAFRGIHDMGAERIVLAQDGLPPGSHNTELHFHSAREEAWFVRSGSGVARLGGDGHELRPGSFWLQRADGGLGHRVEVGPDGMELVTMGDLIPGDVVVYPERRIVRPARGVELPY
jgi:uncharacterized cupin superfamily protein